MFSLHAMALALIIIVVLLISILGFIFLQWPRDRTAELLFVPYAAWVSFATLLNGALWQLNNDKYPTFS